MFLINSFLSSFFVSPFPLASLLLLHSITSAARTKEGLCMVIFPGTKIITRMNGEKKRKGKVFVKGLDILNIVEEKRLTLRL